MLLSKLKHGFWPMAAFNRVASVWALDGPVDQLQAHDGCLIVSTHHPPSYTCLLWCH